MQKSLLYVAPYVQRICFQHRVNQKRHEVIRTESEIPLFGLLSDTLHHLNKQSTTGIDADQLVHYIVHRIDLRKSADLDFTGLHDVFFL